MIPKGYEWVKDIVLPTDITDDVVSKLVEEMTGFLPPNANKAKERKVFLKEINQAIRSVTADGLIEVVVLHDGGETVDQAVKRWVSKIRMIVEGERVLT